MSFQEDIHDGDYRRDIAFHRPATTIVVRGPNDEEIRYELGALKLERSECNPEWLRLVGLEAPTAEGK
jgi:hypothetical protein